MDLFNWNKEANHSDLAGMALFEEPKLEDVVCSVAREPYVADPEEAAAIVETGMANQKQLALLSWR